MQNKDNKEDDYVLRLNIFQDINLLIFDSTAVQIVENLH